MARQRLALVLALGTVYLVWSTTFLGIAVALEGLPPFVLGGSRYLAAGLILLVVALVVRAKHPSMREIGGAALLGLFFVLIGNGTLVWAEQYVPTGLCALLGATTPLWVLMFEACLPRGDRPAVVGVVGILTGFAGVMILIAPGAATGAATGLVLAAKIVLVVGGVLGAIGLLLARRLAKPTSTLYYSAFSMLAGGAAMGAIAVATGELDQLRLASVPLHAWAGQAYLVIFGSCIGYSAFSWLTQNARPMIVSTISYVIPVLAVTLGGVVRQEAITPTTVAAAILIVGSVALVAKGGRRPIALTEPSPSA